MNVLSGNLQVLADEKLAYNINHSYITLETNDTIFTENKTNDPFSKMKSTQAEMQLVSNIKLVKARKQYKILTASLEIIASSPGLTPCLANSLAAYPCKCNQTC